VSLTVAWRTFNHRRVIGDARLLRCLRDAVDVGAERYYRLAGPPRRHEGRRDARDAFLYGESVLLQDVDQITVRLDFLEAELGEAEYRIHHLLREILHRLHVFDGLRFQALGAGVILGLGRRGFRRRSARPR
jgi:hypothetical protein